MTRMREIASGDARRQWREILDEVMTGSSDVAITRHGEPVAVLIPAEDYRSVAEELEERRLARLAEAAYAEYLRDRETAVPFEKLKRELRGRG
jgi:prevent-host-death family protein